MVPVLIGALALVLVAALGVGGFTIYRAMFAAPQLTPKQFDRLESVRTYGGQPAEFRQSVPIGWLWLGEPEGDLPACQKSAEYDSEHLLAASLGTTNPNGGADGEVLFRLFGNNSELATYQKLWADCDAAARAADLDTGKVGSTNGVAWERYDDSALFWYANVQVASTKSYNSDAEAVAEAIAIKATIDSLR